MIHFDHTLIKSDNLASETKVAVKEMHRGNHLQLL